MKNFLAIIGCFTLAVVMIVVFASCGNRNRVSVDDPDASAVQEQTGDEATTKEKTDDADTTENENASDDTNATDGAGENVSEAATKTGTGSAFLDSVLDGVEDVVGEALGGAADVVEEALAGAANKVNDKLNNKDE